MTMTCSVVVPTYRRLYDLSRCLGAIEAQDLAPDEVVVIARTSDHETLAFLASRAHAVPLTILQVDPAGVVAALNVALSYVWTDVVAITDDDTAPRRDWLARIRAHFELDATLGALGGRDHVVDLPPTPESPLVGLVQWFGRTIGKHHIGSGTMRPVDFLKGANMAYRRTAIAGIRFDERLLGKGAQVYNDMAFSLAVRRSGWAVFYDPAVAVDHYTGIRHDEDARGARSIRAVADEAYNETLTLLEHMPRGNRIWFWLWSILIGQRDTPGLAQCLRFKPLRGRTWQQYGEILKSRIAAGRVVRR